MYLVNQNVWRTRDEILKFGRANGISLFHPKVRHYPLFLMLSILRMTDRPEDPSTSVCRSGSLDP